MYNTEDSEEDKIEITVEDEIFTCSRKNLSKNSDYFNVMFNGNFTEKNKKSVNIQEVTPKAFKNVLRMIDKDIEFLEEEELLDTLQCSCMLQFEQIKKYCIERFTDNLRIEYCFEVWHITEFLDIHPLCEYAKCRALIEFNKLKDSNSILNVNIKQLHSYLANTLIYCDNELDIFDTGMKWWFENSNKLQNSEKWTNDDTNNYLLTILSCVDFKAVTMSDLKYMLTIDDIRNNKKISNILEGIISLIDNPDVKLDPEIEKHATNIYLNSKRRVQNLLPCVVFSEFPWEPSKQTQLKKTKMERMINILYHDQKSKNMKKLFTNASQFSDKCSIILEGCKILSYKENLIMLGGEYFFGSSNWNTVVWMFLTFQNKWHMLTRMPEVRRHFQACIIDEKLFILGGTGKYRIKHNDELMFYDFRTDSWEKHIQMPFFGYNNRMCAYKKQLLIVPAAPNNKYCYIFYPATNGWLKLNVIDEINCKFDYSQNFMVYSRGDSIYFKGSQLVELQVTHGSNLKIKNVEPTGQLYGDKIDYYFDKNKLYYFTKYDQEAYDLIFQLHCYDLVSKETDLLIQINDGVDQLWHITRGCFPFFHYNLTKELDCISKFTL